MPDASRSSGVLAGDTIICKNACNLKSIHITCTVGGSDEYILKIFDSKDATLTGNTELARFVFKGHTGAINVEYDMHGVLAREGLFAQLTQPIPPNAASQCAFSVEFN
tara:strand:+ start:193 stop:516 length:324 start_codon:yes stop_codon:yes gene_type:complete